MVEEIDHRVKSACDEIRAYLRKHPHSADSLNGVASFWIRGDADGRTLDIVQRALDVLTDEGGVAQDVLPDGRVLYRAGAGPGDA